MREIRVSPDRNSVAIRSDNAEDGWNAWAVINATQGGHWAETTEVEDWPVLEVPAEPKLPDPTKT